MSLLTRFEEPLWLLLGLAQIPIVLCLYALFDRLQRRRLRAFSRARDTDSALFTISPVLKWFKRVLLCLAALALCVALARPLGSMQLQESEQRGLDILFAIDTSRSMLTPDVKPDRLTRAKLAVLDALEHLGGDGVGLVAFAGEAFLEAPVTSDYEAFRETLDALDTHTIALGGTDIAAATRLGVPTLAARGDTQKVMVLLTDGEDLAGDALSAAQAAARQGMLLFTVGVGTAAGELIPIPDPAGGTQFVKDPAGNFVKSHLDSDMLTQLAAATGGVYVPLGSQGQGVVDLYETRLKGFAQRQHADRQVAVYAQLFQWPLGAAVALLVLEWLLGARVRRRLPGRVPAGIAVAPLLILGVLIAPSGHGSPLSAQDAYNRGQFSQAQRDYAESVKADPTQSHLQFNLGAAAYKAGDFTAAAQAFNGAVKSGEISLQQSAYYNLGNTLFRQGEKLLAADPQVTINTWKQSLGAYDTALEIRPSDAQAKFNRDLVQKRLDDLQRQQQKKPDPKNDSPKQDNKDKSPQDKSQQDKSQQDKSQQDNKDSNSQQNPNGQPSPNAQQNSPQPGSQGPQDQQGKPNPQNAQNGAQQPGAPHEGNQQPRTSGDSAPQTAQAPAGPTQAQPQQASGSQPQRMAAAQDIGKADEMSRQEAEQLLDAAKGEERHLVLGTQNPKTQDRATPIKDW